MKHCIFGYDSDLIIGALSLHENFMTILKPTLFEEHKACYICGNNNHYANNCPNIHKISILYNAKRTI